MTVQVICEYLFTGFNGLFLGHGGKSQPVPCVRQTFNDEGRGVLVKLVDMSPDPAMFGFLEDKSERIIKLGMGAQPDEFALAGVDIGLKHLGIFAPHQRIDAVGRHDQIVIRTVFLNRFEFGLELQINAQFPRPGLQQDQHGLAADPGKAVAA